MLAAYRSDEYLGHVRCSSQSQILVRNGEAEFYEIDFPLVNPETHNIGTKSQQRAHGTEVQNERSVARDFLFVFTATNKKIDLEMKTGPNFPRLRSACGPDVRAGVRPRRLWLSLSGASWIGN